MAQGARDLMHLMRCGRTGRLAASTPCKRGVRPLSIVRHRWPLKPPTCPELGP